MHLVCTRCRRHLFLILTYPPDVIYIRQHKHIHLHVHATCELNYSEQLLRTAHRAFVSSNGSIDFYVTFRNTAHCILVSS